MMHDFSKPIDAAPGQIWQMRNKKLVEIWMKHNQLFPIIATNGDCWMANGRYWDNNFDHSKDLVKQVHPD